MANLGSSSSTSGLPAIEGEEGYFLTRRIIGQRHTIQIDQVRYQEIRAAALNVEHILRFEELWAAVIQNYFDLEKGLLEAAARHMIVKDYEWESLNDLQLVFAVRLSNLLSSCRAYLDQGARYLKFLKPESGDVDAFDKSRSQQYDDRFGYRFMEALRNFSQHCGLPLHGSSYSMRVRDGDMIEYNVATQINVDELRADKSFKQKILEEISDKKISAEPLVRDYIAGLSVVHMSQRALFEERFAAWANMVRETIAEYSEGSAHKSTAGLHAIHRGADGKWLESVHLGEHILKRIETLQRRNGSLERVPSSFVSGAPQLKRKKTTTELR